MADDLTYTSSSPAGPPNNTKQVTDEHATRGHMPLVKLAYSADGDATPITADANGLEVQVSTVPAPLSTTGGGTEATALRVTLASDSTGVVSVDDNGGALTVDGTVTADAGTGTFTTSDTATQVDDAAFTPATSRVMMVGAEFDDTTPDSVNEGDGGAIRMSANRNLYTTIRDAAGNERGLNVDANGAIGVTHTTLSVTGGGAEASALRVTLASDSTGVVSVDDNGASLTVDNATLSVTGGGVESGALRVTIANDSTGVVSVDDNGGALTVDNAGTFAVQAAVDELPAAASLTDNFANPTTTNIAAMNMVWDGSTWDRAPGTSADGTLVNLGANNDVTVTGTVTASNAAGDVAHDSADSGNPVKIGAKAATALPTAVASADRANAISDVYGRLLVSHIDAGMQVWKQVEATTTQTGTAIWTPAAGKKVVLTSYSVGTGGTTAGLLTIWFGASGDTTFTQGTDQVVFRGTLTPSASATPGIVVSLPQPIYAATADHVLRYTTSAGITIYITCYGYEI